MTYTFDPALYEGHMTEYIQKILDRDNIHYESLSPDGRLTAYIDEKRFEELMEDAACEAERDDRPVYGMMTIRNPKKLARLARLNGTSEFRVLKSQADEYAKMMALNKAAVLCMEKKSLAPLSALEKDSTHKYKMTAYCRNGQVWTSEDFSPDMHGLEVAAMMVTAYAENAASLYALSCADTSSPEQFASAFSKKMRGQIRQLPATKVAGL